MEIGEFARNADARMALDPAAPPNALAVIAQHRPDLRVFIAQNPATYPELLDWLARQGDPAVTAALAARTYKQTAPALTTGAPSSVTPSPVAGADTRPERSGGAAGTQRAQHPRRRLLLLAGLGVVGVGAAAVAATAVLSGGGSGGPESGGDEGGADEVAMFSTVDTSDGPSSVAVAADGTQAFVSTWTGGDIAVIDLATGELAGELDADPEIGQLLVDPASGSIITIGPGSVEKLDPSSGAVLAANPARTATGGAIDESLGEIYVLDPGQGYGDDMTGGVDDRVLVFDLDSLEFLRELPIPRAPQDIAVDPKTHQLFIPVNDGEQGRVVVLDAVSGEILQAVPVGDAPFGAAFDAAQGRLAVSDQEGGTVTILDTATMETIATVEVGGSPADVVIDSSRGRVYVSDYDAPSFSVLDESTGEVVQTVGADGVVGGMAVDSQTGTLILSRIFDDKVALFK